AGLEGRRHLVHVAGEGAIVEAVFAAVECGGGSGEVDGRAERDHALDIFGKVLAGQLQGDVAAHRITNEGNRRDGGQVGNGVQRLGDVFRQAGVIGFACHAAGSAASAIVHAKNADAPLLQLGGGAGHVGAAIRAAQAGQEQGNRSTKPPVFRRIVV